METLSRPEVLTLFSILEGELEARDLVIDALKVKANGIIHSFNTIVHNTTPFRGTMSSLETPQAAFWARLDLK